MDKTAKKKILFVITKSNWGGAQRYVYDLATIFRGEYEIVVALGDEGELKKKLEIAEIKTISILSLKRDINYLNDTRVFFELIKIIHSEIPDIVHLNSSKIGVIGSLACKIMRFYWKMIGKKYNLISIFTAHGWAFNEKRSLISKYAIRTAYFATILLVDSTICVSNALACEIGSFKSIQNKIHIIRNGIGKISFLPKGKARNFFIEHDKKLKKNLDIDPKKSKKDVWIGTISELHKNKGIDYVLHALSILKKDCERFVFLICGEGEEKNGLEISVKKLGLENHVFFLGHIENAPQYLKALDIFTLTSVTEGLPYAVLEAGLAELPVVASNVGGIPEIIDQLQSGILTRERAPKEIKEALQFLMENKKKKKEFAQNLKKKVTEEFSIQKMVDETKKVYKK